MRVALDTNVLAYAEGTNGAEMKEAALRLIHRLPVASIVLPVQALGELFNVLVLKAKRPATNARAAILGWRDAYAAIDTSSAVMLSADRFSDRSPPSHLGCRDPLGFGRSRMPVLLSEDLQEGFTWRGVTVTNPFAATPHALLKTLLSDDERDEVQGTHVTPRRREPRTDHSTLAPLGPDRHVAEPHRWSCADSRRFRVRRRTGGVVETPVGRSARPPTMPRSYCGLKRVINANMDLRRCSASVRCYRGGRVRAARRPVL